jgi:hypothetical protein
MSSISDYVTTKQAAQELGLSHAAVRNAIFRKALAAIKMADRHFVARSELERYRREHLGRGWERRRAADYQPNQKQANKQRTYRERKAAARQEQPAEQSTVLLDPTNPALPDVVRQAMAEATRQAASCGHVLDLWVLQPGAPAEATPVVGTCRRCEARVVVVYNEQAASASIIHQGTQIQRQHKPCFRW